MAPRSKREGYLSVDHTASPGLTESQARIAGYDPALVKEGKSMEVATVTCCHCKSVVVKNPWRLRERASCAKCGWHYVCDLCYANMQLPDYDHMPFDKYADLSLSGNTPVLLMKPNLHAPAQLILPPSVRSAAA